MNTRRDFLKAAAALATPGALPSIIQRAAAIEPEKGSTFLDAEHVVILMQENRSFDHCYGSLQGVRGFNDPRAVTLPDGSPVWCQTNAAGETYAPFRLDMRGSNATWLGCLPHDWPDQSRTRNDGRYDRWLDNKRPLRRGAEHLPLTLGYHTRQDLPFYYALADAFTVCDHAFCSSLTGTTPNRLHLWSGTLRAKADPASKANVRNGDAETEAGLSWKTFPDRLSERGIDWRVYQNELYVHTGLTSEHAAWLGNFGDNPLEYFYNYGVRFNKRHREWLAAGLKETAAYLKKVAAELSALPQPWPEEEKKKLTNAQRQHEWFRKQSEKWNEANFKTQPAAARENHARAFTCNEGDPDFRTLEAVTYEDGDTKRTMNTPAGDVLHQFRADVEAGKLPAVSWLVAPQLFSDHPDSPWYGAWYLAEVMEILTKNPAVWAKTIFILCYDENDGYFDHLVPFVPPDPDHPGTGKAPASLRTELEFVRAPQEEAHKKEWPKSETFTGPIGLGYRVPMVIASPWSRGGYVCSEVFDHTSVIRLLEIWLTQKTGKPVSEPNITPWRRAMCGDLTSAFRPAAPIKQETLPREEANAFLTGIHRARFRPEPKVPHMLSKADLADSAKFLPQQEPGTRPACALPYELHVHGGVTEDGKSFAITFAAGREQFGSRSAGAPFHVYTPDDYKDSPRGRTWAFAVPAGESLTHSWPLDHFPDGRYHLRVHGPNGYWREFKGSPATRLPAIQLVPEKDGRLSLRASSQSPATLRLEDVSYGTPPRELQVAGQLTHSIDLGASHGWYDLRLSNGTTYARYAGHVETTLPSRTDPLMGKG